MQLVIELDNIIKDHASDNSELLNDYERIKLNISLTDAIDKIVKSGWLDKHDKEVKQNLTKDQEDLVEEGFQKCLDMFVNRSNGFRPEVYLGDGWEDAIAKGILYPHVLIKVFDRYIKRTTNFKEGDHVVLRDSIEGVEWTVTSVDGDVLSVVSRYGHIGKIPSNLAIKTRV